jgi:uncharacterized protein
MSLNLHTLLFKTVNYCNLDCDYCYVRSFNAGHAQKVLSDEIASRAINDYAELAKAGRGTGPNGRWMAFIWHGGEPTLAGIEFFERVTHLQRRTGLSESTINSLTTNGILIDEHWSEFLRRNHFRISISIDGPSHIHDMHRFYQHKESSFNSVLKGINVLKRAALPFGAICVISEESVANVQEIFEFFMSHDFTRLAFIPRVSQESWLPANEYALFMTKIFDLWLQHDDPNVHIREFENIIHELLGGQAELCEFNGCCGSYVAIDYNGSVYLCDLFIGNDIMKIGNILEQNLTQILDSAHTIAKVNRKCCLNRECFACKYFPICKGGCLYRRCLTCGNPSGKDVYCEAKKRIILHISRRLSELTAPVALGHPVVPVADGLGG